MPFHPDQLPFPRRTHEIPVIVPATYVKIYRCIVIRRDVFLGRVFQIDLEDHIRIRSKGIISS